MKVIRVLLRHQQAQHDLLKSVIEDISLARDDIKILVTQEVDNRN